MEGKEMEDGPPLKRSRQEEELNQAEEEEGLVALVKKRRSDVKLLVNRISTLEVQLKDANKKLSLAEALLETMQKGSSRHGARVKKGESDSGSLHENGHGRSNEHLPERTGSGAKASTRLGTFDGSKGEARHGSTPRSGGDQVSSGRVDKSPNHGASDVHESKKSRKLGTEGRGGSEADGRKHTRESSGGRAMTDIDSRKERRESLSGRGMTEKDGRKDRKTNEQPSGGDPAQKASKPVSSAPPQREHVDLIMKIRSERKPQRVSFHSALFTPSQHRRKMRSLILNPSTDNQCVTSALDGVVNFWQIHAKGLDINFRYSVDCLSPGQRHWPEDLAWHPAGHSIFAIYTADNNDSQVAIIKNDGKKKGATFLPSKPHVKGIMNGITFMPWSSSQFVTGGSDHMVVMWNEKETEDVWKPKTLHSNLHSSAVMGVAGVRHKQLVLSAGADKRVFGFDPAANRMTFQHQLDSKAMSVLPNTADFNLFMVQTGTPSQQLHLFDIRSRAELHTFGWVQESSDTQSALITQSWSPDGLYTASGSADPKIPIFDIRFNGQEPCQTIYAHSKRVFMAVWHHSLPMVLSISSDLNVGVHRIYGGSNPRKSQCGDLSQLLVSSLDAVLEGDPRSFGLLDWSVVSSWRNE